MNIGDRLRTLRLERDMTLEEVGKFIGVSKQTLQRYESGVISNIPSDKIENLAHYYGVSPAYIMGWEDNTTEEVEIHTLAAHATEDLTEEEQQEVIKFVKFLKSQRSHDEE